MKKEMLSGYPRFDKEMDVKEMDDIALMIALVKETMLGTDKNRITELQNELRYKNEIERQNEIETEKRKNYKKLSIEMLLNVEIVKELKRKIPHLGEYYDLEKQEYRIKYRGGDGYDRNITYNRRRDDIEIKIFGDYERVIIENGKEFIMNWLR